MKNQFDSSTFLSREQLNLNGQWHFYADVGESSLAEWKKPSSTIMVPGAWQAQGYGDAGGEIPGPLFGDQVTIGTLCADYLRHNLMARCLYKRVVTIPKTWHGKRIDLVVRRVYRYADVTVNGQFVGSHEGICTPLRFDITNVVRPGKENEIVIGVDNRPREGKYSTGCANYNNWGGIGGDVFLELHSSVWIDNTFAIPDLPGKRATLRLILRSSNPDDVAPVQIRVDVTPWRPGSIKTAGTCISQNLEIENGVTECDIVVPMPDFRPWSPKEPALYMATIVADAGNAGEDSQTIRFGMREFRTEKSRVLLNGIPIYLSGYGDDSVEPIEGMLHNDKNRYIQQLTLMKSMGFNFVRYHSTIPHDAYLEAADEVGMIVQAEAAMQYTAFWKTGFRLFESEWPKIIIAFRNHACIPWWCTGNEVFMGEIPETAETPDGLTKTRILAILEWAYATAKQLDPTRPVHISDGATPPVFPTDIISPIWGEPDQNYPRLMHEYGQYCCSLPDFSLLPRLSGVLRPLTYERAKASLHEMGCSDLYPDFFMESLRMMALAQKYTLERARVNDDNIGYSFWLGQDFCDSPEGCWDEGICNQLWEPKPFLSDAICQYTAPTVLVITPDMDARTLNTSEHKPVQIRISHFGDQPLCNAQLTWSFCLADGATVSSGNIDQISCACGTVINAGEVVVPDVDIKIPVRLSLDARLTVGTQVITHNSWDFYVFPKPASQAVLDGVYCEGFDCTSAIRLSESDPIPKDLRLLLTTGLSVNRHAELLMQDRIAILLIGDGGFLDIKHCNYPNYFLNQFGGAFGGRIEQHPVFGSLSSDGRFTPALWNVITKCKLLQTRTMPGAFIRGSVVWGLKLSGWMVTTKDLHRGTLFSEVITDKGLRLVLCGLDLLNESPEAKYLLQRCIDHLYFGTPWDRAGQCCAEELLPLLKDDSTALH